MSGHLANGYWALQEVKLIVSQAPVAAEVENKNYK